MKDGKKLSEDQKEVEPDKQLTQEKKTEQYATITNTSSKFVLLHVVPVKVLSPQVVSVTTYALLDNASRGTMISSELAKELNLRGRKETILVNTLLQQESQEFEVVEFDLQHASSDGEKRERTRSHEQPCWSPNEISARKRGLGSRDRKHVPPG